MVISEAKIRERMNHIGGSDLGAIWGVDPFKNVADVWASKVYPLRNKPIPAADFGNLVEPFIIEWTEQTTGMGKIVVDERFTLGRFAVNLDGRFVDNPKVLVEAKSTSYIEDFGAEMTAQIPDRFLLQCQTQMMCAQAEECYVPVMYFKNRCRDKMITAVRKGHPIATVLDVFGADIEHRMYHVKADEEVQREIVRVGEIFWQHVIDKQEPTRIVPNLEVMKRVEFNTDLEVYLDDHVDLLDAWLSAKQDVKEAQAKKAEAEARLLLKMEDAEVGVFPHGHLTRQAYKNGATPLRWKPDSV